MGGAHTENKPKPKNICVEKNIKTINQSSKFNLIWIDEKVNLDETNFYKSFIQQNYNVYNIISCENVESGISKIKELSFQETFVILSGRLYKDFIKSFMNNLPKIKIVPKIIIFTGNKEKFLQSKKIADIKNVLKNKFFTLGGIQTFFDEIYNFLSKDSWRVRPNVDDIKLKGEESNELTFEYIDSIETLLLPRFYRTLIKISDKDNFEELNQYLYNTYSNDLDIKKLLSQIEGIPSIPYEILCKYYARLYTYESKFYKDLNKSLRKKPITGLDNANYMNYFLPYVKLLYEGLKLNCFPLNYKNTLYRFSKMSKEEKKRLEEYLRKKKEGVPAAICFSRAFLSFSEDKAVAYEFLKYHHSNNELLNIIFILKKNEKIYNESLTSFIDLSEVTAIKDEKEVLFLPFSAFEIESIKETVYNNLPIYEIELDYLDKYTEKLKLIENEKTLSNTAFKKELFSSGIVNKSEAIKKTNQNLVNDFKDFEKKFIRIKNEIQNNNYGEQILKDLDEAEKIFERIKPNIIVNKELIYDVKIEDIDENGEVQILGEHLNGEDFVKLNKDKSYLIINGQKQELCYKYKLKEGINKIEIVFLDSVSNYRALFKYCTSLIDISALKYWDVKDATCFSCSFRGCTSLKDISPLENWNTSNVVDMTACFEGDTGLTDISPLKNWDVSKVNLMGSLFSHCTLLSDISPLQKWNVNNVHNLSRIFEGCKNLKNISSLKNWKVGNCTNFNCMFKECTSLCDITPLKNWDVSKGISFDEFFKNCDNLKDIYPIQNWNVIVGTSFNCFFEKCIKLTDITPLDDWKVSTNVDCNDIFKDCPILKKTSDSWYCKKNRQ